jgi:putative two-component system response regulator
MKHLARPTGLMDAETLKNARILIVDDQEANIELLQRMLEHDGYTAVESTTDSTSVVPMCAQQPPDLLILDLHMPGVDGFDVLAELKPWFQGRWFPVLVVTADVTTEAKQRALRDGARDFLTKPFDMAEVLLRIRNLLEVRFHQLEARKQNLMLEQLVYDRTRDLDEARLEALSRLALASEYRDDATGEHTQRVGRTSAAIARTLGLPDVQVALIRHAAPLHDVGKIGLRDSILLKKGRLTEEERAEMQTHVSIGRSILSGSHAPLLKMAEEIAWTHHERWDGKGYLSGLTGDQIPLSGRIVAVADVFDALTHVRPYKEAWPIEEAVTQVVAESGTHFDPLVVDAFRALDKSELLAPVGPPEPTLEPVSDRLLSAVG